MSAPENVTNPLPYRPVFSLPWLVPYPTPESYESFPFIPGYHNVSFEEQRFRDTQPLPRMCEGKFGKIPSKSLQALRSTITSNQSQGQGQKTTTILRPSLPIVTIRVGQDERVKDYAIHRNVLAHCSRFFAASLQNEEVTSLDLKNHKPAAFGFYLEWVYSGQIWSNHFVPGTDNADCEDLSRAHILGDDVEDCSFKNAIVDAILHKVVTEGRVDLNLPKLIYDNASAMSPLRRLMVDLFQQYGHKHWMTNAMTKNQYPAAFLSDLTIAFYESNHTFGAGSHSITKCKYHEHEGERRCSNGCTQRHPREIRANDQWNQPDVSR